jgi:putative membrane protein
VIPELHVGPLLVRWTAVATGYAAAVTLVVCAFGLPQWPGGSEKAAVFTAVLALLLAFRNNAAHDRWWEARKLWGQLINEERNLSLQARAHAAVGPGELAAFGRLLIGFAHALRLHLRGVPGVRSVPGFAADPTAFPHAPGYVAGLVHDTLGRWNRGGKLVGTVWVLDGPARALMEVCGSCERIRNTPLASSYRALWRWGIALYVLVAPWWVAMELGWWGLGPLAVGFGFLLGIELTAEAVEEPFGRAGDDLPLEDYCRTVEAFVTATLGTPPPAADGQAEPLDEKAGRASVSPG